MVDVVAGEPYFNASLPLSHTLLADMVGSSRETVTRSLDELRRDGFVARQGHTYRLLVSPDCVALATSLSRS
jgi:CRP-like cAMP-binding protein